MNRPTPPSHVVEQSGPISRRTALKTGAIGGALLWTVPTLQVIGMSAADAASGVPATGPRTSADAASGVPGSSGAPGSQQPVAVSPPLTPVEVEGTKLQRPTVTQGPAPVTETLTPSSQRLTPETEPTVLGSKLSQLPRTGADPASLVAVGGSLLAGGAAMRYALRKRATTAAADEMPVSAPETD